MLRSRLAKVVLLALLALSASGAAWLALRRERPEERPRPSPAQRPETPDPPPSATAGPPLFPRTAIYGDEVMGINEAIGFPSEAMGGMVAPLWKRNTLRRRGEATSGLGVGLVRASSHVWPQLNHQQALSDEQHQHEVDQFFQVLAAHNLQAVMVIGPWPGTRTALFTEHYLPDDLEAYTAWVRGVVERYDGDGVQDMPGLGAPVLAWEIDNEPDLHNAEPPRGREPEDEVDGFETPHEYASVLLATARAIRQADPEALVLSGGIYRPMTAAGRSYLASVLEVPGVLDAIDGVSLHCYFSEDNLERIRDAMATARELAPDESIWITETSVPSDSRRAWVNQDWQAHMVAAIHGALLAEGADRVFWHSLTTPPRKSQGQPKGFGSNALLLPTDDEGFVPKPAALVYRRLAEHLARVELESVHEVAVSGGRLLATDRGWLAFWGEPEVPAQATTVHDLLTDERRPAGGRVSAPAWLEP